MLRWAVHYYGWTVTTVRILLKISPIPDAEHPIADWFVAFVESRYDARFKVETRTREVEGECTGSRRNAIREPYAPVAAIWFGYILSKLPVDLADYTFVDLGSGKGRAMLMASEFPFRRIVGVELVESLHQGAIENIRRFRSRHQACRRLEPINADAGHYELPNEPLIIFMFNPFPAEILERVVKNLHRSVRQEARPIAILYHNPVHAQVLEESSIFQREDFGINPDTDWAIYANEELQAETR